MVNLTDAQIAWIVPIQAALIPLLVALVTTRVANPRVKALANQFLLLLGTFVTLAVQTRTFDLKDYAINFGIAFVTSQVVYENIWKRYGLADFIGRLFPNAGVTTFPLTRSFAPPTIPAADLPTFTLQIGGATVTSSTAAEADAAYVHVPADIEPSVAPVVRLHSGDQLPPPLLFDQAAPDADASSYTRSRLDEVHGGPLEDLSAVTDPLALPMEIQVRNLLMWIEDQEASGVDPAELEATVQALSKANFDAVNAQLQADGVPYDQVEAFWLALNEFGDSEPLDAVDSGDEV